MKTAKRSSSRDSRKIHGSQIRGSRNNGTRNRNGSHRAGAPLSSTIATAFAPATVANVAVGFDIMGFALKGLGERVTVERVKASPGGPTVSLEPVAGYPDLPLVADRNTATAGLVHLMRDKKLPFSLKVKLEKEIPLGSGLGGSAASAVAAIVATNALLDEKLNEREILHYALLGEEVASGARHADNIAPCLRGGLVLVRDLSIAKVIEYPAVLRCVILLPQLRVHTKEARRILKNDVPLQAMIQQTVNLAGFLIGCQQNDLKLVGRSLRDAVIEPQRKHLVPHFDELQKAALDAGGLGCSLSGSGPALFALTAGDTVASRVLQAWQKITDRLALPVALTLQSPISSRGAHLLKAKGAP